MYKKRNKGPRTVPWGTPDKTVILLYVPHTITGCVQFFKEFDIPLRMLSKLIQKFI